MRRLLGVSILVLGAALGGSALAADAWFRLNIGPIGFTGTASPGDPEEGLPPDHGENSGDQPVISAAGGMFRALSPISIPVLVESGSGGYVLQDDHPDLDVVATGADGQFALEGTLVSSGTVLLTAFDMLAIPAEPVELMLSVYDPLVAHGPASLGTVRVGTPVAFDLAVDGAAGSISWEILGIAGLSADATGHVTGVAAAGTYSITAKATDAFDDAQDVTDPFALTVQPDLSAQMANIAASEGSAVAVTPTVVGRIGDLSWELAGDSNPLPSGLSLDEASGQIHGEVSTPASGLRLAAIDSFDGQEAVTNPFSITIATDSTPDPFVLTAVLDAEPVWSVTSVAVTPSGYEDTISIVPGSGTEVSIDGGAWTSSASISPGQSFRLRTTAPDQGQTLLTTVKVGDAEPVTWSVTSWTEVVRDISASTSAADPQSLFGSAWTNASTRKRLRIAGGVTVSSTTTTTAALPINGALAGSLIIENNGIIAGAGGDGGVAGSVYGKDGGNAISLAVSGVKIINKGTIAGGGGGGGMGGKGANGYKTATVREPASGENYVYSPSTTTGSYQWHVFGGTATSTGIMIYWNGSTQVASSASASATSVTIGSYTYYRGAFKTTISTGSKYAVYRTSSQGQSVTGGAGGNGGKGGTYPGDGATGGSGQASPGSGAGAGGKGGNGGSAGESGKTGSTGATGTNGSPVAGYAGGTSGYAISGSPAADSVLGTTIGL